MDNIIVQKLKKKIDLENITTTSNLTTIDKILTVNGTIYATGASIINNITYTSCLSSQNIVSNVISCNTTLCDNLFSPSVSISNANISNLQSINIIADSITCNSLLQDINSNIIYSNAINTNILYINQITSNTIHCNTCMSNVLNTSTCLTNICNTNNFNSTLCNATNVYYTTALSNITALNILSNDIKIETLMCSNLTTNSIIIYDNVIRCILNHYDSSEVAMAAGLVSGDLFRTGDIVSVV